VCEINEIERRVLSAIDGRERLKILLKDSGLTMQTFAQKHGLWVQQVSMCLSGDRRYPEIRNALASELEIPSKVVDSLIDGEAAA
jgi:transcriptional regulator with XRE-family HTH domain